MIQLPWSQAQHYDTTHLWRVVPNA